MKKKKEKQECLGIIDFFSALLEIGYWIFRGTWKIIKHIVD